MKRFENELFLSGENFVASRKSQSGERNAIDVIVNTSDDPDSRRWCCSVESSRHEQRLTSGLGSFSSFARSRNPLIQLSIRFATFNDLSSIWSPSGLPTSRLVESKPNKKQFADTPRHKHRKRRSLPVSHQLSQIRTGFSSRASAARHSNVRSKDTAHLVGRSSDETRPENDHNLVLNIFQPCLVTPRPPPKLDMWSDCPWIHGQTIIVHLRG